jgi:Tfp pilus assembly protein PilO
MSKLLITSVLFFCLLILGNFVLLPRYRSLNLLNAEVAAKELELSSKEEYVSQLESLSRILEKHPEELSKIDFALPLEPNLPSLFEFLQGICSDKRLVLKRIGAFAIVPVGKDTGLKRTRVGFEVSGTFDALMDFLSVLEKSARLIEVSQISFRSEVAKEGEEEEGAEAEIFTFKITANIFSYQFTGKAPGLEE